MDDEIKEKLKSAGLWIEEEEEITNALCDYWSHLSNRSWKINQKDRLTVKIFLKQLEPQEVKEAMEISFSKVEDDFREIFKYFCGVCNNKIKQLYVKE